MVLVRIAGAWLAGIAAASALGWGAWPLAVALAAILAAWSLHRREPRALIYAAVLPLIFIAALARFDSASPNLAPDAVAHYNDGVAMRVRAVLRDDPDIRDTTQRFAADVLAVQVRGEWQAASGGVQVTVGLYPRYESGDVVEMEGALESPSRDAPFDYADYLAQRGIGSTIAFPHTTLVGHEDDGIVRATVLRVRRSLSDALALALPEPQSSLAQSVLLGERSALPPDIATDLNATNTSHLVVVSGSNIVLVSAFATLLFGWFAGRRRALALSIAFVLAYAALVGFSAPVLRATIMGILLVVAQLSGRPSHSLTSIVFAAAVMTGISPHAARDVSFQLSFAATAGIVFLAAPIRAWSLAATVRVLRRDSLPRIVDAAFAEPLSMTLAAIIATEPLIAMNFGRVSLVAIPANMLVVPAFGIILGASLFAAIGGLIPHAHVLAGAPAYYALSYWISVAHALASLPGAYTDIAAFDAKWAAATYAAITAAAFAALQRFRRRASLVQPAAVPDIRRLSRLAAVAVPVLVMFATAGFVLWPSQPARLQVTVLDVGQGDAILIEAPGGQDILIDGGPGPAVLRGLGDELSWRDRSLDAVVLTHPQADHMYGLIDVLDRYDVRRVFAGPGVQPSPGYAALAAAAAREGGAIETIAAGRTIDLGDGARLDVLGPTPAMATDPELNNTGAVIKLTWRDVSFLFTADIEQPAEQALLDSGADLHATVLKVGHHGSKTSSTAAFLDAVRPAVSVVSSGKDNQFGHPNAAVVTRLAAYGTVLNTADVGAVHFSSDGQRIWVSAAR
jgi:competence protein ComEC